jgi:hypothetical protein
MLSGEEFIDYAIRELGLILPFDFEKFYKFLKLIQD